MPDTIHSPVKPATALRSRVEESAAQDGYVSSTHTGDLVSAVVGPMQFRPGLPDLAHGDATDGSEPDRSRRISMNLRAAPDRSAGKVTAITSDSATSRLRGTRRMIPSVSVGVFKIESVMSV